MRAEYANAFIRAAAHVFETETGLRLSRQDLKLKPSSAPVHPVVIVVRASGAVRGQVVFAMAESVAYEVTRHLLPGRLPAEVKRLLVSAVGEVANMITGRSAIELAGDHDVIDIAPPQVYTGTYSYVEYVEVPTIHLSLLSNHGTLEINLALQDAQADYAKMGV